MASKWVADVQTDWLGPPFAQSKNYVGNMCYLHIFPNMCFWCFLLMFLILFWWVSLSPWFSDGLIRVELKPRGSYFLRKKSTQPKNKSVLMKNRVIKAFQQCIIIPNKKDISCKPYTHILPPLDNHIPPRSIFDRCVLPWCASENRLSARGCFDGMIDGGPVQIVWES